MGRPKGSRNKKPFTPEMRKRWSILAKQRGDKPPIGSFRGHHHSIEGKRRISLAMGKIRRIPELELRRNHKNSEAQKGREVSVETRRKISLAGKGMKRTEEFKRNLSVIFSVKYYGSGNPMWNGGTSFLPYPPSFTEALKESIRQRDGYRYFVG